MRITYLSTAAIAVILAQTVQASSTGEADDFLKRMQAQLDKELAAERAQIEKDKKDDQARIMEELRSRLEEVQVITAKSSKESERAINAVEKFIRERDAEEAKRKQNIAEQDARDEAAARESVAEAWQEADTIYFTGVATRLVAIERDTPGLLLTAIATLQKNNAENVGKILATAKDLGLTYELPDTAEQPTD